MAARTVGRGDGDPACCPRNPARRSACMIAAHVFDAALALLVLGVAVWTVTAGPAFAAVIGFVAYRLAAGTRVGAYCSGGCGPDRGSDRQRRDRCGAHRRGRTASPHRATSGSGTARRPRCVLRPLCCRPSCRGRPRCTCSLPGRTGSHFGSRGCRASAGLDVGNPVTAVLLAYRSLDTLLEKVVLLLALMGVWSLAPDRFWGGAPRSAARRPARTAHWSCLRGCCRRSV